MRICTDNEPYIPYLPGNTAGTPPEGRMPIFQSDWTQDVIGDWGSIIEVIAEYNVANTPYMGDIPSAYRHHPAGFGQGFGGLQKEERYFDVHLGWLMDQTYLTDAFFAIVETSDNVMTAAENKPDGA